MGAMSGTMQGFKLDDDSSEEDIDEIPAELRAYHPTRIDKKRKHLQSWKDERINPVSAFFKGKMRSNDYVFVWSSVVMAASIIIMGAAAATVTEKSMGIMIAFTVLFIIALALSLMGNIVGNRHQTLAERIMTVLSFVMIYIAGIVYMVVRWDLSLLTTDDVDLNIVDKIEKDECLKFLAEFLILIPLITALIALGMKAYRDNMNGRAMTPGFWIILVLCVLQSATLTVVMFAFLDAKIAWGLVFVLFFTLFGFFQYSMRVKYSNRPIKITDSVKVTPYMQGRIFNVMNIVLGLGVFLGLSIFVINDDSTANFAAGSMMFGIIIIMLSFLLLAKWVADRTRMDDMPIYHSPWIFPIYKYYPEVNDIEPYTSAVVQFYFICMLVMIWCFIACAEVSPSWFGVGMSCVIQGVMVIVSLYFMNTNNLQYRKVQTHVD